MKTLPIRCRFGDTRPVRAIAYEAVTEGDKTNPPERKPRDSCPTLQFMEDASTTLPDEWADLSNTLDEIAKNGPPKNTVKFDFIADGIREFKSWKLRIACFFDGNLIICTHGFYKKQSKTPKGELDRAKTMRNAYLEAQKRGNINHVLPKYS